MEEENKDDQEVHETPEEDSNSKDENVDIEDLKKKAERSSQNHERAKNAEAEVKRLKAELEAKNPEAEKTQELGQADIIYLAKADIHEDDLNEVVEYAKLKKVSVKEAHNFFQPILNERAEERKTASATQTKGGSRGSAVVKGEDLLRQAEKGKLPESEEDFDKIAEARMKQRIAERAK